MSNIVITGGGTGGHLSVAKAIAEELLKEGIKPIYIGSINGQDREWFEDSPLFKETYFFDSRGVVNKKNPINKIKALTKLIRLSSKCREIFRQKDVDRVFSVGGFSAAPASLATLFSKTKLYIHEQNSRIGSLNRLLKPYAKGFFSSYYSSSPIKDYPVSDIFFEYSRLRDEVRTILFLGGSQGAKFINDLALNLASDLKRKNIHIIHQCGAKEYDRVTSEYEKLGVEAEVYAFSKEIWELMRKADFAISRSGAGSLWELSANALPAFYIPYPYAASNHQYYNALFLEEKGAAFLSYQADVKREEIFKIIDGGVKQQSERLKELVHSGGARKIVEYMLTR
ncbi:MAG: UDP-N-acetylglucosamine--N-acetylmuramyl-(pentapeptide) pyrophosphoryl-undecaprenol N-acetylglucosamine transferase [Campylobacterales bacterium]